MIKESNQGTVRSAMWLSLKPGPPELFFFPLILEYQYCRTFIASFVLKNIKILFHICFINLIWKKKKYFFIFWSFFLEFSEFFLLFIKNLSAFKDEANTGGLLERKG